LVLVTAVVLVCVGAGTVVAQSAPTEEFSKTYGGAGDDWVLSVAETSDSGFAIAGRKDGDALLIKTDSDGNEEFSKTYGGDDARSVVETSDGGFAIAGLTSGGAWLVKTDSNGNVEFNKTYGNGTAESVIETSDGGFAIAGQSVGAEVSDAWLIKTDSKGNVEFNETYGGGVEDTALSLVEASDGGFALAGRTESFASGGGFDEDAWLIKTDSNGNAQFNKTYGGGDRDVANSVVETSDGGFALGGETWSFGSVDPWLIKTDASGNEQFNKSFGGGDGAFSLVETSDGGFALAVSSGSLIKTDASGNKQFDSPLSGGPFSVAETSDGGFALAGIRTPVETSNAWFTKTDENGTEQFNKTFGGSNNDEANSVVETSDGGFALAGFTGSFGAGIGDAWLIKLSPSLFAGPLPGTGFENPPRNIPPEQGGFDDNLYEDLDGDGDGTDVAPTVRVFGELIRGNDLGLSDDQARSLNWNPDSPETEVTPADMVSLFGEQIRAP